MQISEIFDSIQGEGPWMGYPATFVRMYGCNLDCSFCDTRYAKEGDSFDYRPRELADIVLDHNPNFIVFTGGEPALQMEELAVTISTIRKIEPSRRIAIETNGTIDFDNTLFDVVIVSPKSMSVITHWCHMSNVYMKFLIADKNDVECVRKHVGMNTFANMPYVMPMGTDENSIKNTSKLISDEMISTGMVAILTPRLHILMGMR